MIVRGKLTLGLIICLLAMSGCSSTAAVKASLIQAGMPTEKFEGDSTVITKFMNPSDVSDHCSKKIHKTPLALKWYHACVYTKKSGVIVLVAPKPGSIDAEAYAALLEHEYQHIGQAIKGEKLGHADWN